MDQPSEAIQRTTVSRTVETAFVLDRDSLRRLSNLLAKISNELAWTVRLSDESSVEAANLEGFLDYSNLPNRKIVSIACATSYLHPVRARVQIGSGYRAGVSYQVVGPDRDALYYSNKIEEWISSIRDPYAPLALLEIRATQVAVLFFFFVGIILVGLLKLSYPEVLPTGIGKKALIVILAVFGFAYWGLEAGRALQKHLFPASTFAIGDARRRYERVVSIRTAIGVGFGLSLLASLAAAFLWRILGGGGG